MKLLMFHSPVFRFRPYQKTLVELADQDVGAEVKEAVVIFVHAETADYGRSDEILSRSSKNIKWLANKRGLRNVVLHSFTHLADNKAEPGFAREFLEKLASRLRRGGYAVWVTPFGYTCEWELSVYGDSIAKVFKAL